MTFFYNLNKKLDSIREKPETTHKQLNERDMSRAAKGIEKYSKEVDEGSIQGGVWTATPPKSGQPNVPAPMDPEGVPSAKMTPAPKPAASAPVIPKMTPPVSTTTSKLPTKEGRVDDVSKSIKSVYYPDKARPPVQKFDKPTRRFDKYMDKNSPLDDKEFAPDQTSRPAGMNPDPASRRAMGEQGGAPMTAKQKSFAKLAPPANKITFADKIAGAKKEVDEMLGDVAAEAMKNAMRGKQQMEGDFGPMESSTGDYSAKKARAGKDIGKPGKAFGKIAADAGKRYGSKAAGERVAGAVLNKLRHPSESMEEGWDDMEKDVKRRMSARRVGDVTHGDKHDTQEIPGGRRVTRRVDPNTGYSVGADSDAPADGEKRGRGRPKGAAKAPERVTAKATKHKGGRKMAEDDLDITDRGEYDQEGSMAKDDIHTIVRHARALEKILGDNDNLPEWVQAKLAKIEGMMTAVDDYMQDQKERDVEKATGEEGVTLDEKAVSKKQQKFMGMVHATQKGEKAPSKEVAKVAKSMKKSDAEDFAATKHKGLPEKAPKKKEKTEEAGGSSTPTASSGFSYGKGIYDSVNRELEEMIAESMNISMNTNTDGANGPTKSLTVTATDEDAAYLAQILKSAGLGGGDHGDCGCGTSPCSCDSEAEHVDENKPDWPSNTETSHDAMQYSGGLNKPKASGMATIPVTDVVADGEDNFGKPAQDVVARVREMAGIKKVKEDDMEEGNLFTKGLEDNDVKVGDKIPGTNAIKTKDIDTKKVKESILDIQHLWNEYKG